MCERERRGERDGGREGGRKQSERDNLKIASRERGRDTGSRVLKDEGEVGIELALPDWEWREPLEETHLEGKLLLFRNTHTHTVSARQVKRGLTKKVLRRAGSYDIKRRPLPTRSRMPSACASSVHFENPPARHGDTREFKVDRASLGG